MGKALVIPNVDFSVNKLATVVIANDIPCIGITLSQSTVSMKLVDTLTLTATVTPANTTDGIIWSSSNPSIASVSNGVVRPVGFGSAVITASCGAQSASCSVTISDTLSISDFVTVLHGTASTTKSQFESGRDYTGISIYEAGTKLVLIASPSQTVSGYRAFSGDDALYDGKYPIMIPSNATKMVITASIGLSGVSMTYMDSTQQPTTSVTGKGAKVVSIPSTNWSSSPATVTFPQDIDGLDSFVACITFKNEITEIPSDCTIVFS